MLLPDLFAQTVALRAGHPAVDVPPGRARPERTTVTYAELAAMAAVVRAQVATNIHRESTVVVLLPRSTPWLYAAQLGVMQAGAAHVCLDPSFPSTHMLHVVRDCHAVAIVTDATGAAMLAAAALPTVVVPCASAGDATAKQLPQPAWLHEHSLAYVIYTSGTTGLQKGVLLEHAGVTNLITQGVARFALGPGDRIAQGSSPAYDSSIEETWLALASGACVVVLDDDTVRLGPDLVPWLRRERITVFCPPPTLLRAMDCRSPRDELPTLRLCYVGGEPLTADLAEIWGQALWLENGYGPTECTVTVVRARVHAGEPVSIGTPVPPHRAFLLDEQLLPVAEGEPGELCIHGVGLARGYLGLPDLTAARFPTLPGIGRVYRTGDLAQRSADGRLCCLGRIDAQVKLRGYRIELEAIETVLAGCAGVREAACSVQGEGASRLLAAHVVPDDEALPPTFAALERAVRAALPEYMVPARFALRSSLPRTVGGKIDRKALPSIADDRHRAERPVANALPVNEREQGLCAAFAAVLGLLPANIGTGDDFFALGGDSLRAAMLVSRLRRHGDGAQYTVRNVYEARTVAVLARLPAMVPTGNAPPRRAVRQGLQSVPAHPLLATGVQTIWLLAFLGASASLAYGVAFGLLPRLLAGFPLVVLLMLLPWLGAIGVLVYTLAALWFTVLTKELLIGRYEPTRVPVWSWFHVRHWLVVHTVRLVPWSLLQGTEAQNAALRALGARIGKRVHIHRGTDLLAGGWDLLDIGDDATIGREAGLGMCDLDAGDLVVGAVRIGAGATLETRSGTGPAVDIGAGAVLRALSFLPEGTCMPAGEAWDGVPAQRVARTESASPLDVVSRQVSPWLYTVLLLTARVCWAPIVALPVVVGAWLLTSMFGIESTALRAWLFVEGPWSKAAWVLLTVVLAVIGLPLSLVVRALALRWTPAVPVGTHSRWSLVHLRLELRSEILEAAGVWLSGTLFWPWWLQLAGMRIGKDCEVSTILDVVPEHVQLGAASFLADGIYLGVPRRHQGRVTVARTELGERTFLGNHVVIDTGQQLPGDLLLGVNTVAKAPHMTRGSSWFGHPAFQLPRREVVQMDRRLTHAPGLLRYTNRLFWESLRMLLPALPVVLGLWWFDVVAGAADEEWHVLLRMLSLATLGVVTTLAGCVLVLKWALLGRVRPGQHGLWSCWASRWDFHYVVWHQYGRALLSQLEGTLWLPWYLRAMGMRIGRRVVLGDGFAQVVDPDMLTLEDGATVHAMFQAHSFEDRVLKIDRVRLGAGCTVGRGAVVLYGADIGAGAHVAPHSVVMKHELLLPHRDYAGVPTAEVVRTVAVPATATPAGLVAATGAYERDEALDLARGLAVFGMVWLHLVPEPDEAATGFGTALVRASLALEGVPAALFVMLAGMAWAMQGASAGTTGARSLRTAWVLRRSLALASIGVPFWLLVWPTEVLLPMAMMLPLVAGLLRLGRGGLLAVIAVLLALVPPTTVWFGSFVAADCLADGSHVANHQFGVMTLRYFLFDGSYPLLPWLVFPALGALLVLAGHRDRSRSGRWFWLAVPLCVVSAVASAWAEANGETLGDLAPHLQCTWQPTSIPFVLRCGAAAIAVIAGFSWWSRRSGLPRWLAPVALLGRASLTHYLGHIVLVYATLRLRWPHEDWPVAVGVREAIVYLVAAMALSWVWFRHCRRGPLEAVLAWLSGPARRTSPAGRES